MFISAMPGFAQNTTGNSSAFPLMIKVETGSFIMGSDEGTVYESPAHQVHISSAFMIAAYKITYAEYDDFCIATKRGLVAARGQGRGKLPVSNVTWHDAVAYCNWLSQKHDFAPCYTGRGRQVVCDFSANGYRLPTEAEWEYAALGGHLIGSGLEGSSGLYGGFNNPDDALWCAENSNNLMYAIGLKKPNALGLYEMGGNIFEWCWDWFSRDYYTVSPIEDPRGPPPPTTSNQFFWEKVRRGGSWRESADHCRVFSRSQDGINMVGDNCFRLVRTESFEDY